MPAQCSSCHEKAVTQFAASIHSTPRTDGKPAATCATCHGSSHDMMSAKHLDSPVSKFNLPVTCGKCHEDPATAAKLLDSTIDVAVELRDAHGTAPTTPVRFRGPIRADSLR